MTPPAPIPLRQAFRLWLRIGLLSFGGPAGQIALMHRELCENRALISEKRFLQGLGFANLLPGPEATQLATYLGWLMHGTAGGLIAGILFVLPGAVVMLALSIVYARFGQIPAITGIVFGLKCAVLALVAQALLRLGRRALAHRSQKILACLAFASLFALHIPFPVLVVMAGAAGALAPPAFHAKPGNPTAQSQTGAVDSYLAANPALAACRARSANRAGIALSIAWLAPLAILAATHLSFYAAIAWFFSKMAVVTLGGAYAVLTYVAQDAVHLYHWLTPQEMLAGLGLAETTPGPLILVLQFVGFIAGYHQGGLGAGILAAALTLWCSFLPCYAFVFFGAASIEPLSQNPKLAGSLAAINACVAGVIANLAVWFAQHLLFTSQSLKSFGPLTIELPAAASLDGAALFLSLLIGLVVFWRNWSMGKSLLLAAAAGLVLKNVLF